MNPALFRSSHPNHVQAKWPGVLYGLIALAGCMLAFVGLSRSSLWADELYTMQVIDHHRGLAEVFHRVLADVHPPLYDFFLYGWVQFAGTQEWAVRLPSAIFAVAAIALFAAGLRPWLSGTAIAFACAIATTSMFWFVQAQNARNYALAVLISAALLIAAIRLYRHARTRPGFSVGKWLWLSMLGIAGSQVHPYMLLTVGMLVLFMLVTMRGGSWRIALFLSGTLILGLYLTLLWLMTHRYAHDFHNTWYSNKPAFFFSQLRRVLLNFMDRQAVAVVVILLLAVWLRPSSHPMSTHDDEEVIRWASRLSGTVCVGVMLSGIVVSVLVAPSFSYRNVLVCAPFGWFLLARLYDVAGPRVGTRLGAMGALIIVLLLGSQCIVLMRGRQLPTNEPWRASAAYVESLPGCAGITLPVITFPGTYGMGLTPGVHTMIEHHYYGYYLSPRYHPYAYLPDELIQHMAKAPLRASACPLIAWGLHDMADEQKALALAKHLAAQPGLTSHQIVVQEFVAYQLHWFIWKPQPNAYVFLQATPATIHTSASLPKGTKVDQKYSIGDRLLITFHPSAPTMDAYEIQRFH